MASRGRPKGSRNKTTLLKSAETPKKKGLERIKEIEPPERNVFYCCCCGKKYIKQKGNFTFSQSPLYKGNNSYLPICNNCIENLIEQYTEILGTQDEAIKRVCMHWDIYFSESVLNSSRKTSADQSRFKNYIRQLNLSQSKDKTYDDFVLEESKKTVDTIEDLEDLKKKDTDIKIKEKVFKFWGRGYTPEQYKFLQDQYDDWTTRCESSSKVQQELFKALSISQLQIQETRANNGDLKKAMETFQGLLGSANLKPAQNIENNANDEMTFGMWIRKVEDEEPVCEPAPEWKDVDGIGKYITVYFLGHLCKMMGIKNSYSKMYEDEMAKYTVEKPEYEGDDEAIFDAVFGGGLNGDNTEEDG